MMICGTNDMISSPSSPIRKLLALAALLAVAACSNESSKKRLLDVGNKYAAQGKLKEASLIYRKAIQKDPRYGDAYYQLGLIELKLGRYGEAMRSLQRASELLPGNDDAHSKLGDLYLSIYLSDRGKFKQVLTDFGDLADRILKRNPNSFQGLRMKGYQMVAENKMKEASEYFEKALSKKPDDAAMALANAQAVLALGDKDRAIALARANVEKHKSFGAGYDFLYLYELTQKNIPGAEAVLRSKADNNPKNATFIVELATHYVRAKNPAMVKATLNRLTSNPKDFPTGPQIAGDFYFRSGAFEDALREYEAGIKQNPNSRKDIQKRMVEVMNLAGRRADAVDLAEKLVAEFKDDAEAQAIRASLRLRGGSRQDVESSIKEFQSVITRMPDNPVVRFNLGEALMAKGEIDQARVQFNEAIKLRSTYLPPKMALARIHLMKGEFPKAMQLSDEVLQLAPRSIPGHLIRASSLMGQNDLKAARAEIDTIFQLSPENKDAYYLRAMMDYTEQKLADSREAFNKLYTATPMDPRGLLGLVEIAMAQNKPAEAKALLQKELDKQPDSRVFKLAMANVLVRAQDYNAAQKIYLDLLAKQPDSEDLNLRMGEVFMRNRNLPEALKYFEKAGQINPQNQLPLMKIAAIYEQNGEKAKTRPIYERILKIAPDNPIALNNLAYMMAEGGTELDQALTYAQRAKQKMPNNPDVADTLGWVYIKKNLSDDAIKIFRDLLQVKPEHVTWRYHLAIALFQKGDKLQAKKELEAAMKNNPRPEETQKIRELMGRIG